MRWHRTDGEYLTPGTTLAFQGWQLFQSLTRSTTRPFRERRIDAAENPPEGVYGSYIEQGLGWHTMDSGVRPSAGCVDRSGT
jgi:hypothetical protein